MIDVLLDEGSFSEIGRDGGFGTIEGRPVCVYNLKGVFNGCDEKVAELALKTGSPLVVVVNVERFEIDFESLKGLSKLSQALSLASGVIPRIGVFLSDIHWMFAQLPLDFKIGLKGKMFSLVLPEIIESMSKERATGMEDMAKGGIVHLVAESDEECIEITRRLFGYLPLNNMEDPPIAETSDDPARKLEFKPEGIYDVRDLVRDVMDDGDFFELMPDFAPNAVVGFGRLDGTTVGVVGNNPFFQFGCLDVNSARKISWFVRFCDAFNVPVVSFVDTPGFIPSNDQERGGLAREISELFKMFSEVTSSLITVVIGKAYGVAGMVMGSKLTGADVVYAYPNAEFAVTDLDTDVKRIYGELGEEERRKKVEEYRKTEASAERALERGFVDAIIEPEWTRSRIINALRMLETKRRRLPPKKHDT